MPGESGASVGFDRARLERLRHASLEALDANRRIHSSDWFAHDPLADIDAATSFLTHDWLPVIDRMLQSDALDRSIAGWAAAQLEAVSAEGGLLALLAFLTRNPEPLRPGEQMNAGHGSSTHSVDHLGTLLDEFTASWPTDADERFLRLGDLSDEHRRSLQTVAEAIAADPGLLDELLGSAPVDTLGASESSRVARRTDALAVLAAGGALGPMATLRIAAAAAAAIEPDGHADTGFVQLRRHTIVSELADTFDELVDRIDADTALAALERPEIRNWLASDDQLDDTSVTSFVAAGLLGPLESLDPDRVGGGWERSRAAWLAFVDVAERHGAHQLSAGLAHGLALGAAAHLPAMRFGPSGGVTDHRGEPIQAGRHGDGDADGDDHRIDEPQVEVLLGSIVTDPIAEHLLLEAVHDELVSSFRQQLAVADERMSGHRGGGEVPALARSLVNGVQLLDVIFDDAVDQQQARWNEIARAEAGDRQQLLTLASTVVSLVPGGNVAGGALKTTVRSVISTVRSNVDDTAPSIERPGRVTTLDVQLGREIVADIADSPTLRELV
ncbi:MAG: hypothetical protein AAGG08_09455, partial [Actinomycetota bacterium]